MSANAYPLQWPTGWDRTPKLARAVYSPFNTSFARARALLIEELRKLGATDIVISSNLPLRQDGFPSADGATTQIEDPGVAVYFLKGEKPTAIARDLYRRPVDNLRCIGKAVEHIRGLERHGGSAMVERAFTGFAALPAPQTPLDILGVKKGATAAQIRAAYQRKAKGLHPDLRGGSGEAMAQLNVAYEAALATTAA
jgi:hypothetical protein